MFRKDFNEEGREKERENETEKERYLLVRSIINIDQGVLVRMSFEGSAVGPPVLCLILHTEVNNKK